MKNNNKLACTVFFSGSWKIAAGENIKEMFCSDLSGIIVLWEGVCTFYEVEGHWNKHSGGLHNKLF